MSEFIKKNKNKLITTVAAIGLTAAAAASLGGEKEEQPAVVASVSVDAADTIGRSASGWEHGAAERAIEKGLEQAAASLKVEGVDFTEEFAELPTYDNAMEAVEMAREDGLIADKGDKMKVSIDVTADSNDNVSYEVTDAEIIDIPNNQK